MRGFRESFVAFVHKGFNCTNFTEYKIIISIVTSNCPSENLEVTVEISLVGFIIQSNGSELSYNVYFNVCISF